MSNSKNDQRVLEVTVELIETSQPIELQARNTYTKGPLYCVYTVEGIVHKFPIQNLFRVKEQYSGHSK